jgi:hypothetical protein
MKKLVDKLRGIERTIAAEKGDLVLFALFLREGAPDRWDLIVSAPWAVGKKSEALAYVVSKIEAKLTPSEIIKLSRVVFVDPSDAPVKEINRALQVEHGETEIHNRNFFGLQMEQGFIITSKRRVKTAA